MLLKYAHVFHDEGTNDFLGTNIVEHHIPVGDVQPIRWPPYRTPFALREEMQSQIQTMLDKGGIRKSHCPWSAPAILVPRKSADGKPKYRFCVEFRALNSVTKSILTRCQILKKLCPPYKVQNNLTSLISILGSGSYTSLNHIKREPLSTSCLDITNFINCYLAWLIVPPIFKGVWTQSWGTE
jgi:hypothetical protein